MKINEILININDYLNNEILNRNCSKTIVELKRQVAECLAKIYIYENSFETKIDFDEQVEKWVKNSYEKPFCSSYDTPLPTDNK